MRPDVRTEDDVRGALASLDTLAPAPAAVLPPGGGARPPGRAVARRAVLLAGAAATVAVAVPFASRRLTGDDARPPAEPGPRHPWALTFAAALDGFQVDRMITDERGQRVGLWSDGEVAGDDEGWYADLAVHDRGGYDATAALRGEQVRIGDRVAYWSDEVDNGYGLALAGLAWEHAPGSWAIAHSSREWATRLVATTRFGVTSPLFSPFRLGVPVPAGLWPAAAAIALPRDGSGRRDHLASFGLSGPGSLLQLTSNPAPDTDAVPPLTDGAHVTGPGVVTRRIGTTHVTVESEGLPTDVLVALAESITPCDDLDDRSTWFEATTAIPLG